MKLHEAITRDLKEFFRCVTKYARYVALHKWYVFVECRKVGITWRGVVHDWHKLLPDEWFPYAYYFNHTNGVKFNGGFMWEWKEAARIKHRFDIAWLKHQKRGKHHWQYWLLINDSTPADEKLEPLEMPEKHALEMLCDWRGAGKAITGKDNTGQWYINNRDKIVLHENTRKYIEERLFG